MLFLLKYGGSLDIGIYENTFSHGARLLLFER